jgi:hypothetical protein
MPDSYIIFWQPMPRKRSLAMSETEWIDCREPDLMLDEVEGTVRREQLVDFVRRCWERITPYLPPVGSELTVVEEFAALAGQQSDHDAALYAYEAALKAARWAPVLRDEQAEQAALLRHIVGRPS